MRYTEYHAGKAVIKDRSLLAEAMEKLAKFEDMEKCGEWVDAIELVKMAIVLQGLKWIPCSERLSKHAALCCDRCGAMLVGFVEKSVARNGRYYAYDDDGETLDDCVAWMPLPEPYKQNDEGVED